MSLLTLQVGFLVCYKISATNVKPTFHLLDEMSKGKDLILPADNSSVIEWKQLAQYFGDYVITSDGTTLV